MLWRLFVNESSGELEDDVKTACLILKDPDANSGEGPAVLNARCSLGVAGGVGSCGSSAAW